MEDTQVISYTQDVLGIQTIAHEPILIGWLEVEGNRHELKEGVTKLGRDSETCQIVLEDKKALSKEHALFDIQHGECFLKDLGSRNKTRIGKSALHPHVQYALRGGENLVFGNVKAVFVLNRQEKTDETVTLSDTDSESILEPTQQSPTINKKVIMNESSDCSMISPTPHASTSRLNITHVNSPKNFVPETPGTVYKTNTKKCKMPSNLIEESPLSQSTPQASKVTAQDLAGFISPMLVSPMNDASGSKNNSSNDCLLVKPCEDDVRKVVQFEENDSDESTDIEDFFEAESKAKDKLPSSKNIFDLATQQVLLSESETENNKNDYATDDSDDSTQAVLEAFGFADKDMSADSISSHDETQDVLAAFNETQDVLAAFNETQDVLAAFNKVDVNSVKPSEEDMEATQVPSEEDMDATQVPEPVFDRSSSGTAFRRPTMTFVPVSKVKKLSLENKKEETVPNIFEMATQALPGTSVNADNSQNIIDIFNMPNVPEKQKNKPGSKNTDMDSDMNSDETVVFEKNSIGNKEHVEDSFSETLPATQVFSLSKVKERHESMDDDDLAATQVFTDRHISEANALGEAKIKKLNTNSSPSRVVIEESSTESLDKTQVFVKDQNESLEETQVFSMSMVKERKIKDTSDSDSENLPATQVFDLSKITQKNSGSKTQTCTVNGSIANTQLLASNLQDNPSSSDDADATQVFSPSKLAQKEELPQKKVDKDMNESLSENLPATQVFSMSMVKDENTSLSDDLPATQVFSMSMVKDKNTYLSDDLPATQVFSMSMVKDKNTSLSDDLPATQVFSMSMVKDKVEDDSDMEATQIDNDDIINLLGKPEKPTSSESEVQKENANSSKGGNDSYNRDCDTSIDDDDVLSDTSETLLSEHHLENDSFNNASMSPKKSSKIVENPVSLKDAIKDKSDVEEKSEDYHSDSSTDIDEEISFKVSKQTLQRLSDVKLPEREILEGKPTEDDKVSEALDENGKNLEAEKKELKNEAQDKSKQKINSNPRKCNEADSEKPNEVNKNMKKVIDAAVFTTPKSEQSMSDLAEFDTPALSFSDFHIPSHLLGSDSSDTDMDDKIESSSDSDCDVTVCEKSQILFSTKSPLILGAKKFDMKEENIEDVKSVSNTDLPIIVTDVVASNTNVNKKVIARIDLAGPSKSKKSMPLNKKIEIVILDDSPRSSPRKSVKNVKAKVLNVSDVNKSAKTNSGVKKSLRNVKKNLNDSFSSPERNDSLQSNKDINKKSKDEILDATSIEASEVPVDNSNTALRRNQRSTRGAKNSKPSLLKLDETVTKKAKQTKTSQLKNIESSVSQLKNNEGSVSQLKNNGSSVSQLKNNRSSVSQPKNNRSNVSQQKNNENSVLPKENKNDSNSSSSKRKRNSPNKSKEDNILPPKDITSPLRSRKDRTSPRKNNTLPVLQSPTTLSQICPPENPEAFPFRGFGSNKKNASAKAGKVIKNKKGSTLLKSFRKGSSQQLETDTDYSTAGESQDNDTPVASPSKEVYQVRNILKITKIDSPGNNEPVISTRNTRTKVSFRAKVQNDNSQPPQESSKRKTRSKRENVEPNVSEENSTKTLYKVCKSRKTVSPLKIVCVKKNFSRENLSVMADQSKSKSESDNQDSGMQSLSPIDSEKEKKNISKRATRAKKEIKVLPSKKNTSRTKNNTSIENSDIHSIASSSETAEVKLAEENENKSSTKKSTTESVATKRSGRNSKAPEKYSPEKTEVLKKTRRANTTVSVPNFISLINQADEPSNKTRRTLCNLPVNDVSDKVKTKKAETFLAPATRKSKRSIKNEDSETARKEESQSLRNAKKNVSRASTSKIEPHSDSISETTLLAPTSQSQSSESTDTMSTSYITTTKGRKRKALNFNSTEAVPPISKRRNTRRIDEISSTTETESGISESTSFSSLNISSTSNPKRITKRSIEKTESVVSNGSRKSMRRSGRCTSPSSLQDGVLWSPAQRQAMASKRPRVLFTSFKDVKDEKIVKDLGGVLVENVNECNVLVTTVVRRTVKLLGAIARGVPVVGVEWLTATKSARNFVDPWEFLIEDKVSEQKFNFCLKNAILASKKKKLLTDYSIYVTDSVKPGPDQMKEIIQCADGHYLEMPPKIFTEKIVVISCKEDKKLWAPLKKLKLPIVNSEFILSGILNHKILTKECLIT